LKKRAAELGLELESLSFKSNKVSKKDVVLSSSVQWDSLSPAKNYDNRRPSSSGGSRQGKSRRISRSRSETPPPRKAKCTIFARMDGSEAYLSISLKKKSVSNLLSSLEAKCPNFSTFDVVKLYQKNKKGMIFHLDDDMMEYIENKQIFNIELRERMDEERKEGKFDMTLEEVEFF
jgi:hypothetical protein